MQKRTSTFLFCMTNLFIHLRFKIFFHLIHLLEVRNDDVVNEPIDAEIQMVPGQFKEDQLACVVQGLQANPTIIILSL